MRFNAGVSDHLFDTQVCLTCDRLPVQPAVAGLAAQKEDNMAGEDEKRSYPKIPAKNWWDLRRRLTQAFPKKIDADYLQSVLGLSSKASAQNLIAPLRAMGLIDDQGRPSDRANAWRSDDGYSQSCHEILNELYPESLRDAFPPPSPDIAGVRAWFQRNLRVGDAAGAAMASVYALLAEADASGADRAPQRSSQAAPSKATNGTTKRIAPPTPAAKTTSGAQSAPREPLPVPTLHVDVQVHLPTDATAEQIDHIFASMAKHLYGKH